MLVDLTVRLVTCYISSICSPFLTLFLEVLIVSYSVGYIFFIPEWEMSNGSVYSNVLLCYLYLLFTHTSKGM